MSPVPLPAPAASAAPGSPQPSRLRWAAPLWAALLVIALLATFNIRSAFRNGNERAQERLQTLAELQDLQVEAWLQRHLALAGFLGGSEVLAQQFLRWQDEGEAELGDRLLARMVEFRKANDADGALLAAADGRVLAQEHPGSSAPDAGLQEAVARAVATGHPTHTGIYRREGHAVPVRMDVVVPLLRTGAPVRGLVVLRIDPERTLFPLLSRGPFAGATLESLLWRRTDERIVLESPPRLAAAGPAASGVAWAQSALPVAQALRGDRQPDIAAPALDYRGVPVLSVVRQVQDSDWWLVAKMDQSDVDAAAWATVRWTLAAALLAMAGFGLALRLWAERQSRRLAEHEQREQRDKLRALRLLGAVAESSADAIFAKNLQGRYVLFNRAAAEELGIPPDEALGRTDTELYGPEVGALFAAHDALARDAAAPLVFEERLSGLRGERIKMCTKGALRDSDGQLVGTFGVSRDVTEAQRAEQALRASEAHYRSVVAALTEGLLVTDLQGRVLSANPAVERLLGRSPEQMVGGPHVPAGWQVMDAHGAPLDTAQLPPARVLASGEPLVGEVLSARSPDGQLHWFEVNAYPLRDAAGLPCGVVTSFTDITERKHKDDELARHRERLEERVAERTAELSEANRSLVDAARFINTVTDALPGRVAYWDSERRCRYANRAWFEWFGVRPEDAVGRTAEEILGEGYWLSQRARIEAALAGQAQVFERESQRGERRRVDEVHYLPDRDADGSVRGLFAIAFDITALKDADVRMRQVNAELELARDRAEAANRAKSAFLANMSHEIRTPMNAIIGLTHLMARETRDAMQRERLAKVDGAAQHLLQVINDVLDLSKIEAGKLVLEEAEFSLDTLLSRCFEMVSERARDKGLELVLDTDHLPARMRGDSTRLSQALINLLSNAVKFTDKGFVRVRGELLREERDRLQVRFEVQDTGIGLSAEQQAQLFRAFEQGDTSSTRRHGGTGLGLALTRHLAQLMNGEAGVRSEPGAGSTFWFTAWLGRAAEAGERAAPLSLKGMRVLLVDDLAEARAAESDRLRLMGLQVDALGDGESAVRQAQLMMSSGQPYDVLLIDWRMAPLDGVQTLERLREVLGAGVPPSVLVTAFDETLMWQQARGARFDAVLVKPITASALHDVLVRVLRHQPQPLAAPAEPGAGEALLRTRHAGQRVLLAEDNPINQEVAGELLAAAGLEVEMADDGERAVELVLSRRYDLVLMDVQMPRMDGLDATRAIRERAGRALPVIAMTAHAFGEDRAACLAAGMNDHVAKPVDPEQLYATLLRWLPLPVHAGATPTAAPAPPALDLRLAAVPGLDVAAGLRNVGGQLGALQRVLGRFVANYRSGEPALAAGSPQAARRHACHSLRGACATIGATALREAAAALEQALDGAAEPVPPAIDEEARRLDAALVELVRQLDAALETAPGRLQ